MPYTYHIITHEIWIVYLRVTFKLFVQSNNRSHSLAFAKICYISEHVTLDTIKNVFIITSRLNMQLFFLWKKRKKKNRQIKRLINFCDKIIPVRNQHTLSDSSCYFNLWEKNEIVFFSILIQPINVTWSDHKYFEWLK